MHGSISRFACLCLKAPDGRWSWTNEMGGFMANDVTVRSALWQLSLVKYEVFILEKESNSTATCWGFQCISVAFEHTSISKNICNLLYMILILNLTVWWFGDFLSLLCWWNRFGEAQRAADEKIKEKEWMWVTTWMICDAVSSERLQKIGWHHVVHLRGIWSRTKPVATGGAPNGYLVCNWSCVEINLREHRIP